jgi:hypothetical protein
LNIQDLNEFLSARKYEEIEDDGLDPWDNGRYREWARSSTDGSDQFSLLKISVAMFDDNGRIRFVPPDELDPRPAFARWGVQIG